MLAKKERLGSVCTKEYANRSWNMTQPSFHLRLIGNIIGIAGNCHVLRFFFYIDMLQTSLHVSQFNSWRCANGVDSVLVCRVVTVYLEASCHSVHPSHCMYTFHENITGYITNFNKPHMSVFQPVSLSLCLSACLHVLSVCLFMSVYLFAGVSACLAVCLLSSVYLRCEPTGILLSLLLFVTHTHTQAQMTLAHCISISGQQTACRQSSISELS